MCERLCRSFFCHVCGLFVSVSLYQASPYHTPDPAISNHTFEQPKSICCTAVGIALECSDIVVSAIITYFNLSWSGWISFLVTILATVIVLHTKDNPGVGNLFLPFFAFFILPLVVMFYLTVTRRDAAQRALGKVKAQVCYR